MKSIGITLVNEEDAEIDVEDNINLDASVGDVLYRTDEGFAVPMRVTMEGVYDYQGLRVAKKWDDLKDAVESLDGTPFIAHHPLPQQSENEVPIWGRSIKPVLNPPYIDSTLFVYNTAPKDFRDIAEKGGDLPISMGFTATRHKEDGEIGGKAYTHCDKNIRATHVAYAPKPWKARCNVCRVNPGDADGLNMIEGDALIPPENAGKALEELLDIKDDFELGRTARAVIARIIAGGLKVDADPGTGEGNGEGTGENGDGENNNGEGKNGGAMTDGTPSISLDQIKAAMTEALDARFAASDKKIADQIGAIDARLKPLEEQIKAGDADLKALKEAEAKRIADAKVIQDAADTAAFDALLSEGGKAANVVMDADGKTVKESGVLKKEFDAAPSKATWLTEAQKKGYLKGPEIQLKDAQGTSFIQLDTEAGAKALASKWTKEFHPKKEEVKK